MNKSQANWNPNSAGKYNTAACSPLLLVSLILMDSPIEHSLQTNIICLEIRILNYVFKVGL